LRQAITPTSVVLEIGTGPGFFALLAAKFGARHVYAVDSNNAVYVGRELAVANGVADRITFMQDVSTNVTLPERVDVIVSDIRGALPWLQHHIPSIVDARERLLAPGGVLIPQRDTVWAAVVNAPDLYAPHVVPWYDNAYGLDLRAARQRTTNQHRKGRIKAEQLLVEPQPWATLDYTTIIDPNAQACLTWIVPQSGTGHGLSVWFDTELLPGVGYSNAPDAPHIPIYSQIFFPWTMPVDLSVGDRVQVTFRVHLMQDDYVWSWHTRVDDSTRTQIKARFTQASFAAQPTVSVLDEEA
jgi:protein arginine N-methyltransferase 1